ncbi:MAG: hypothetical protein ACRDG2_04230, partial [Actinomycetota bacterium]
MQVVDELRGVLGSSNFPAPRPEPRKRGDRKALERRLEQVQDEFDDGLLSEEQYVKRRDRLMAQLGRLGPEQPRPWLERVAWESLSPPEQRLALREMLTAIIVQPTPTGKSPARWNPSRVMLF